MSNEEVKEISYYKNKATSMKDISVLEDLMFFESWLNKFEYVAEKSELPDHKMGEFLITMLHNNIQEHIELKYPHIIVSEFSYEVIINYYYNIFSVFNEFNLHRKRFYCRFQYEEETIEEYTINLRKIYNKCYKIYKNDSEEEQCAQFIKGISENVIRTLLYIKNVPKFCVLGILEN